MENEKKDIHHQIDKYDLNIKNLLNDKNISKNNKNIIIKYLHDSEVGKTVLNKAKKRIKKPTLNKYIFTLKFFAKQIKTDFDALPKDDRNNPIMEKFITNLENNKTRKSNGEPYSEQSKKEIKITVRRFYKWLYGENKTFPPLVDWIEVLEVHKEIPALDRETIEYWVGKVKLLTHKAFIMALFDSGCRIEEFLNIKHKNVSFDKENRSYKIRIEVSKTKPRTIFIPIATPYLRDYMDSLEKNNPESYLFDYSYDYVRKMLRLSSLKILKKAVNPHLLRHSSATYYCTKINPYELCYRYGWSMTSKMPSRYIDREGITELKTVKAVNQDNSDKLIKENQELREDMSLMKEQMTKQQNSLNLLTELTNDPKKIEKLQKALELIK